MKYENISEGIFISRPNRFTAHVYADGGEQICHVKNTGRCRELLTENARVILERAPENSSRRTKYSLIAVYKGDMLINMDSAAPNKAVCEWLKDGGMGKLDMIRPEFTLGNSRFDFYAQADGRKILIEVKGVTLENNGIAMFPDAPTARGLKHITELMKYSREGYETYVFLCVQMSGMKYFTPNYDTDPAFSEALEKAYGNGVGIICRGCAVTPSEMTVADTLEVRFKEKKHYEKI